MTVHPAAEILATPIRTSLTNERQTRQYLDDALLYLQSNERQREREQKSVGLTHRLQLLKTSVDSQLPLPSSPFPSFPQSPFGKSSESVQCAMLKACDACADMGQL